MISEQRRRSMAMFLWIFNTDYSYLNITFIFHRIKFKISFQKYSCWFWLAFPWLMLLYLKHNAHSFHDSIQRKEWLSVLICVCSHVSGEGTYVTKVVQIESNILMEPSPVKNTHTHSPGQAFPHMTRAFQQNVTYILKYL